jgi:hypothetical protein
MDAVSGKPSEYGQGCAYHGVSVRFNPLYRFDFEQVRIQLPLH